MHFAASRSTVLLANFTQREFKLRFAGSVLGVGWALLGPVILLGIYSLVFGQFFAQQGLKGSVSYIGYVAIALWPWMMFADGTTRGMMAIQQNASLVKKITFPHALLVVSAVNAVFLQHALGYVVVLAILQSLGLLQIHLVGLIVAIPLLAALYVLTTGIALALASLQTLLKDVEQGIAPALMMLHFLTPVMYPVSMIPASYRDIIAFNPLAYLSARLRATLLSGEGFLFQDLAFIGIGVAVAVAGYALFTRLSPYFEDFL